VRILIDLDEVLVDFAGAAARVHGWTRERLNEVHTPGIWSIVEPMGLSNTQFWRKINELGSFFWSELKPLPWAEDLLSWVKLVTDDWWIVTSPSFSPHSYVGKLLWLRGYFGEDFDRFIITKHKYLLANPETLLIDDREEAVAKFRNWGGLGAVFPSRHNGLHCFAYNPVAYLIDHLALLHNIRAKT